MSKPVEVVCSELLRKGVSCDGLFDLANACRAKAKSATPILPWLGLEGLFRGLANSIHDRPVQTPEIERLTTRLRPILETLSKPFDDPAIIEKTLVSLRDLL
jgi:hypothetical protein